MSYVDVYFSRINHMGETTAERIRSGGMRSFEKWLAESPHTVRQLSVERGIFFDGIILTNKDKEYEKIMFLNVANNIPLLVGDIMTWVLEDGTEEKWIIVQEEKKVNGTYRTFWIIRCNYYLKWIDAKGFLNQSWAYVVSSVDSKIKGNYRTWNNLITPQPNKYAEILMPRYPIDRATNFIIEDESWQVIEYDHTSVPGTIYLSLTENKINSIYDDTVANIADTDKWMKDKYTIAVPAETQKFILTGEEPMKIEPVFTLLRDGVPVSAADVQYFTSDKSIVRVIDNELYAISAGTVTISLGIIDHPDIELQTLEVEIGQETTPFSYYIIGPEKVRLGTKAIYNVKFVNGTDNDVVEKYELSDTTFAKIVYTKERSTVQPDGSCIILANDENKLTKEPITLTATVNSSKLAQSDTCSINIAIIPLW